MTRIPITDQIIKTLEDHRVRTGIGVNSLLYGKRREVPKGLNSSIIRGWVRGATKTARQEHFEYVLSLYSALPDNARVEVSDKDREELQTLKRRTAFVVKGTGLKPGTASAIVSGRIQKTRKNYLDWLLEAARSFPPETKKKVRQSAKVKPITVAQYEKLRFYRDHYGFLPGHIFKNAKQAPEGLRPHTISKWLDRTTKSTQPRYIKWVFRRCEDILKG